MKILVNVQKEYDVKFLQANVGLVLEKLDMMYQ